MQERIQTLFAPLIQQLPKVLGKDDLIIDKNNLPVFDEITFDTTQIAIKNSWHTYNDFYKIQYFQVSATPEYYQILGLTIFCAVLQNKTITINLTNPHSFIKKIVVGYDYKNLVGLTEKPVSYHHYSNKLSGNNPYFGLDYTYFPGVFLTSDNDADTEEAWAGRDTLLFGQSSKALTHLAEVLLDFGNPNNQQPDLVFEGHAGNCNLLPMSCEIRFWLPDSLGWFDAAFS
jgi:hypothetical protein